MYGKVFQRLFQGSMVGSGSHVFSVWAYCIANAEPENHTVDLNPTLLSAVIGDDIERIKKAIEFLASPDPDSHCKEYEGRRLVHQTGFEYFMPTHELYRDMKNNEELRAYFRESKRRQRMSKTVKDSLGQSTDLASVSDISSRDFDAFWAAYPRKIGKKAAFKAWCKATDRPSITKIVDAINTQKQSEQWRKDGGKFIPHPQTWLNQGRWDDQIGPQLRWKRMNPSELMPEGFEPKPEEINRVYMKTEVK